MEKFVVFFLSSSASPSEQNQVLRAFPSMEGLIEGDSLLVFHSVSLVS